MSCSRRQAVNDFRVADGSLFGQRLQSCVPTSRISMGHDPIKASNSRFRKGKVAAFHHISIVLESSRFRSWVGYIAITNEWPERSIPKQKYMERMDSKYHRIFVVVESCFLPTLLEGKDEPHRLQYERGRRTKCSLIPSSVSATVPRKCSNQEQIHLLFERMYKVATTARGQHRYMERGTCWGLCHFYYSYQSNLNILDLYSFSVIYCDYGKEECDSSFLTGSASALPCFCAFPVIATEHPLCRFDEEPGI